MLIDNFSRVSFFKELINREKEAKLHPNMDIASERNNFDKMSLSVLKEYLKARGVSGTGYLKPALVDIAKSVEKMMIPVLDYAKSKEEEKRLIIYGIEIEDPLSSARYF